MDADIYQYELPWIKVGQPVTMTLDYMPGQTFAGKIDYIYPYLKEATRTAKVRLRFSNPGLKLKPEMFAQVKIESPVSHQAVVVPADAVIDTGLKQHVFIALGQGRFEPREVKLGVLGDDGLREVISGLKGGEDVVTSAQFMLDSESRFREAVQMMMPGKEKEGTPPAMPEMKPGEKPPTPPAPPPPCRPDISISSVSFRSCWISVPKRSLGTRSGGTGVSPVHDKGAQCAPCTAGETPVPRTYNYLLKTENCLYDRQIY